MDAKPRLTLASSCLALALCGLLPVATTGCHKKQEGDNMAASAPAAAAPEPAPAAAPAAPATTPETTAEATPPMSSDAGAMSSGTAAAPITGQATDTRDGAGGPRPLWPHRIRRPLCARVPPDRGRRALRGGQHV